MRPLIAFLALLAGCEAPDFEAFRLEYDHLSDQVVLVEARYAVMIIWRDAGETPSFHFYDKNARRHLATESWEIFLAEVSKVPAGTEIQRFNTCCAPCDYAMPDDKWQELKEAMKGRVWQIDPINGLNVTLVCTCESKGFRFTPS